MGQQFNFFDYHSQIKNENIMVSYKGAITAPILSEISQEIRQELESNRYLSRKVFSVFIELAQNVSFYSTEINRFGTHSDRVGTLVIYEEGDTYVLMTGNLVHTKDVQDLTDKCLHINSLNHDELRAYKREQRKTPSDEKSKGAGIGLIQVALLSNNPLKIESHEMDDQHSFFSISVIIQKPEKHC